MKRFGVLMALCIAVLSCAPAWAAQEITGMEKMSLPGMKHATPVSPTPSLPHGEREQTNRYASLTLKPFVRGSYQKIVSARQGKPFIVNFWSLSCGYCKVELAMLKKLAKKYPGLDLVLVSTDMQEEEKLVSATMSKFFMGKAEAWVFADSYTERLRFEVDRKWQGELPRTYFYSAKSEVTAISGQLEQKDVEQWIKEQSIH